MSHHNAQEIMSMFAELGEQPIITTTDIALAFCECFGVEPSAIMGITSNWTTLSLFNNGAKYTEQVTAIRQDNHNYLVNIAKKLENKRNQSDKDKKTLKAINARLGFKAVTKKAESTVNDSDMLASLKRDYMSGKISAVEFATTLKTLGLSESDESTVTTTRGKVKPYDASANVKKGSAVTVYARKVKANVYTVNSGESPFVHTLAIGEKFNADIYSANDKNKRLFNVAQKCIVTAVRENGGFSFKLA